MASIGDLPLGTKAMRSRADLDDYITQFNKDDLKGYSAYYHPNVVMNFPDLPNKTLAEYREWVAPIHAVAQETLNPMKVSWDRDGQYIAVDYHTQFVGLKDDVKVDDFAHGWGPLYKGAGPLVQMMIWYHLNPQGQIIQLDAMAKLLTKAPPA